MTDDDILAGAVEICKCVENARRQPFFIGRNGTIELEAFYFWLTRRCSSDPPADYPERIVYQIQRNAGVFPSTNEAIDAWCKAYSSSLAYLTGAAAGWYKPLAFIEAGLFSQFSSSRIFKTPLRSLEPYYVPPRWQWTRHLAGKRVAVVSSFADTIRKNVSTPEKLDAIWRGENAGLLGAPDIRWSFVRTGYAPATALGTAGWPAGITSWQDAVGYVVGEVLATGAEIALIGCGGLGMIIGAELRKKGVSAIVLGGAIQVLFGVKGNRWRSHEIISKFWNESWVWPAADEIPMGAKMVEGACYWSP